MHVVVTSAGSDGDFNPLLAIAGALVRRGVTVTFVANPFYEARVLRTGCRFVGAGDFFDIFAALRDNPRYFSPVRGGAAIWKELAVPNIRDTYPVVCDTVEQVGAAAVVSHVLGFGGMWAAAQTGVRNVTVSTTPSVWPSRHHPTVFVNRRAPRIMESALTVAARGVGNLVMRRLLRRLAAEIGAPAVPGVVPDAHLNLGVWPDWFRPRAADDPPGATTCGFVFGGADASEPLPDTLDTFLAAGAPPVVTGFGSAVSVHAKDRYRTVADACEQLGRRCVLIGTSAAAVAPTVNRMVVPSAPYARLFPAAAAVVHHGGFGTCGEVLRAGNPNLITPFGFDQFDNAARVHDAGMGQWFTGKPTDTGALAAALDSVLRSAPLAAGARAAAAQIAAAPNGADRAAELIAGIESSGH